MEAKKGADSLRAALENGMGPHLSAGSTGGVAPQHIDQSVPEGMTHVRRVTREEAMAEIPNITENNIALQSGNGILKANDPLGFPGKFRLKRGLEERLLVVVEPEVRKDGRRTKKQITAFFDRKPGEKEGLTYAYKNPVHCANLRCNQYIEEVF